MLKSQKPDKENLTSIIFKFLWWLGKGRGAGLTHQDFWMLELGSATLLSTERISLHRQKQWPECSARQISLLARNSPCSHLSLRSPSQLWYAFLWVLVSSGYMNTPPCLIHSWCSLDSCSCAYVNMVNKMETEQLCCCREVILTTYVNQ